MDLITVITSTSLQYILYPCKCIFYFPTPKLLLDYDDDDYYYYHHHHRHLLNYKFDFCYYYYFIIIQLLDACSFNYQYS
jgi:hypothetical protein